MRRAPWSRRSDFLLPLIPYYRPHQSFQRNCADDKSYIYFILFISSTKEVQRQWKFTPTHTTLYLILSIFDDLEWKLELIPVEICHLSLTSKLLLVGCGEWLCEYTKLPHLTVLSNSSSSGGSECENQCTAFPPYLLLGQDQCLVKRLKRKYSILQKDLHSKHGPPMSVHISLC